MNHQQILSSLFVSRMYDAYTRHYFDLVKESISTSSEEKIVLVRSQFKQFFDACLYTNNLWLIIEVISNPILSLKLEVGQLNKLALHAISASITIDLKEFGYDGTPSDLIDHRMEELRSINSGNGITYLRNMKRWTAVRSDAYQVDPIFFEPEISKNESFELKVNGYRPTYWPERLFDLPQKDPFEVRNAVVLPDMTVVDQSSRIIFYESVKAAGSGWVTNLAQNNNFFTQIHAGDRYVELELPEINADSEIDEAFLIPNCTAGYGHFIHDAMPILDQYKKYLLLGRGDRVLHKLNRPYDKMQVHGLIDTFFTPNRIELSALPLRVKNLTFSESPFIPRMKAFSRAALLNSKAHLDNLVTTESNTKKIYISRADGVNNRIGERDVLDFAIRGSGLLESKGYHIVELSKLTHSEQAQLFSNAECVFGIHGAGLMNIVFAKRKNVRVIEILVEPWSYYTIAMFASALEFEYHAVSPRHLLTGQALTKDALKVLGDLL